MIISYGLIEVELSGLPETDKEILLTGGLNPSSINTSFLLESGLSQEGVNWVIKKVFEAGRDSAYCEVYNVD